MINIEKFIKIRKSLKLSQNELCNGICTQSTLSKFENNGQIPSFKILKQLCERMNISLSDIVLTSTESEIAQKLFSADFYFITYDYDQVRKILKQVNEKKIRDKQDLLHYNYLCGQLALDGDHNDVSALFYFNNILTTDNLKADNIYRLLALKGCSQVYASQDMDKASHYFDQILGQIKKVEIKDSLRELQVMSILTAAGEFYGQNGQYKHADDLLNYAYELASSHHVVYFLARVVYQLALDDLAQKRSLNTALEHLHDSLAFARLNKNEVILKEGGKLLKELEEKAYENGQSRD